MPPKLNISGKVSNYEKQNKNVVKDKSSQFFLTINTNQSYKDNDNNIENDTAFFTEVIENVLNNIKDYLKLSAGDTYDDSIKDVDVQYVIERGTKKRMIHSHVFIKFTHTAKDLKLDYTKIKSDIANNLGLNNIFFNCRLVHNNDKSVLEYIDKYVEK